VAESLAAKVFLSSEPDAKAGAPAIRPMEEPVGAHDKVHTWHS
jgi:hypothetical protein